MRFILSVAGRHWGKLLVLLIGVTGGAAYFHSSLVRRRVDLVWQRTLAWAGFEATTIEADTVYWCPMHPQIKDDKENAVCPICNMALVELEGGAVEAPERLTLTAQQVQQAGVATAPVVYRRLYREIDTTGRITYDERRYAGISSWVSGKSRIDKLHVSFTGEFVKKGELVAEIYSPDLISAQDEFLILVKDAAQRRERTSPSTTLGLGPGEMMSSSRERLLNQGMTPEQINQLARRKRIWERIPVYAPISGTVIARHVQEGQYVSEGDWLFHLADLSRLWLFVDVYEDELPMVNVGTQMHFSVSGRPGEELTATVSYIEPKVRPETRTAPVRIDIDNRDGRLVPGMFARARLQQTFPSVLAVPENAVLWSGTRAVVIVEMGEGVFEPREVDFGRRWLYSVGDSLQRESALGFGENHVRYHEVLAGLAAGEQVVTSGAFLLNAESQFQNVLAKMLPPKSRHVTLEQIVGDTLGKRIRSVLDDYFKLSRSLSADELEEVPARMAALTNSTNALAKSASESGVDALTTDATRFHQLVADFSAQPPKDAVDARTRFGRISHELTKLLEAHGGKTLFGRDIYQFECGMAGVGYERWLWWSPEIHNPYMGRKMLKCGTKLDVLEP